MKEGVQPCLGDFLALLQAITLLDWLRVGVMLLCLVPSITLFIYFRRTGVSDYLLYCGMWLIAAISQFTLILQSIISFNLIVQKIADSCYILFFFLLFFYTMRTKWEKGPRLLWFIGLLWYFILQFLILISEVVSLPENGILLFVEMRKFSELSTLNVDFGVISEGGIILWGRGFPYLTELYRFFVLILMSYVYMTSDFAMMDKRVKKARNLYISLSLMGGIGSLLVLGHGFNLWNIVPSLPDLIVFIVAFGVAYIMFYSPESVILSKVQVIRASNLYQTVVALKTPQEIHDFGMIHLVEYLRKLPPELFIKE